MQHPGATDRSGRKSIHTLLVEPDPLQRQRLELALSVRGHSVVGHGDPRVALAAFQDDIFQLVVLGGSLLDEGAGEFCRRVRSTSGGEQTTIIVAVTDATDQVRDTALQAGADDVVVCATTGELVANQIAEVEQIVRSRIEPPPAEPQRHSELFLILNPDGSIRAAAPVAERLIGFPPAALNGVNAFSFFHPEDAPQLLSLISEAYTQPVGSRAAEVRVRRDGDDWRTITISATNRVDDPRAGGIAIELRGPDAAVSATDQVTRATMHDRVTGLPNRALFLDRVEHAIARSARSRVPVVVMSIDLNGFQPDDAPSPIEADDSLILAVAQRLRSCLRSSDTTSRLDHDQFGVLLEDIASTEAISIVADRIIRALTLQFFTATGEVALTPHLGTAVSTSTEKRATQLLRDAGIARAWARVQGSGSHVLFDPSMTPPDDEPVTSEFAPIVSLHTAPAIDQRLDDLSARLASLEQAIARFGRDA